MKNDGGAAFPSYNAELGVPLGGMTMRQWYKGMALRDCGYELREYIHENNYKRIAAACGAIADAMLAEDAAKEGENG